ncbi:hypothetical protein [Nitrosomonas sp. Nm58]|jgi:hypothetical protein|uniref:hypothetical protein n=1 Tax=Nitrosomonas sp. Nm58 TaxID=200126 RepID=UPI0008996BEE|nr:hypothetical protein [Nitrosomonas sp. Nm58]SDY18352.1 hypothetical protein SAMN05421754_100327 [Nitrosomonas sp. Nm58]
MNIMIKSIFCLFLFTSMMQIAVADVCEYTPRNLIGAGTSGSVATGAAATTAAGIGMKAAGFYILPHATTGATMLASTAGGASAAGTVGIMGGTAGAIGTVSAVLMSPFVITSAAITALGIGIYEGVCYLREQK